MVKYSLKIICIVLIIALFLNIFHLFKDDVAERTIPSIKNTLGDALLYDAQLHFKHEP